MYIVIYVMIYIEFNHNVDIVKYLNQLLYLRNISEI